MPVYNVTVNGQKLRITAKDPQDLQIAVNSISDGAPQQAAGPEYAPPTEGMSGMEQFMAGAGKAVYDVGRGIGQMTGMIPQEEIDAAKARDAALMATTPGMLGNVAGNIATSYVGGSALGMVPGLVGASAALSAPRTLGQAAAGGAAMGAVQPVATDESRLQNIAGGAAGGGIGYGAAAGLGRMLAPQTPEAIQELMRMGVTPTPGQILGPTASAIEQTLTSIPFGPGELIKSGQISAIKNFNTAVGNEVLSSIGKRVPKNVKPGTEMVRYVGDEISNEYKSLLPKMSAIIDDQFTSEINTIRQMGNQLPKEKAEQLNNILNDSLVNNIGNARGIRGETIKKIETRLGQKARRFKGSSSADDQDLGDALTESLNSFRALLERNNPEFRSELSNINKAYAKLKVLENAAARVGSAEGVFSPEAFRGAVKSSDTSLRDRQFARGQALMQPMATEAVSILGKTIPNSGTAERLSAQVMPFGVGLGGISGILDPSVIAALLGTGSIYGTEAGRKAAAAALTQRPEAIRALGRGVYQAAPVGGLLGSGFSQQ